MTLLCPFAIHGEAAARLEGSRPFLSLVRMIVRLCFYCKVQVEIDFWLKPLRSRWLAQFDNLAGSIDFNEC